MTDFLSALALVLVLEGIVYAAFGPHLKKAVAALLSLPDTRLRVLGLVTAALGLVLLWAIRG